MRPERMMFEQPVLRPLKSKRTSGLVMRDV
jgi:hypothetical protein